MKKWTTLCVSLAALTILGGSAAADDQEDKTRMGGEVTLYFGSDDAELDPQTRAQLDEMAAWLMADTERTVIITAKADAVAGEQHDALMGERRAQAIRSYLVDQGVDSARVHIVTMGEAPPATAGENTMVLSYGTRAPELTPQDQVGGIEETPTEPEVDPYSGYAAEPGTPPPSEPYGEEPRAEDERPGHLLTPNGMSVSIGGGVVGFIEDDMRDFTGTGGSWEARVTYGTRSPIAVEAAYVGTAQSVDALGLDEDALLVSNGVEGNVRVNVLQMDYQPYLFGGIGWSRYNLARDDFNTSSVKDEEDILYVPLGVGFGFQTMGFAVDVRGTYRVAFEDELLQVNEAGEEPPDAGMDSWAASARVGWEF